MPEEHGKDIDAAKAEAKRRLKLGKKLLKACSKYEPDMKVIRPLIEQGAKPDVASAWDGRTPLVTAVGWRNVELAELLLARGADANQMFNTGNRYESLLHIAVGLRSLEMTKLLVRHGARIDVDDLAVAIENRDVRCVEFLLTAGVPDLEANGRTQSGIYALQCAQKAGDPDITRLVAAELARREQWRQEDAGPGGREARIAALEREIAENAHTITALRAETMELHAETTALRAENEELRHPKGTVLVSIKLPLPPAPGGKEPGR